MSCPRLLATCCFGLDLRALGGRFHACCRDISAKMERFVEMTRNAQFPLYQFLDFLFGKVFVAVFSRRYRRGYGVVALRV